MSNNERECGYIDAVTIADQFTIKLRVKKE